MPDTSMGPRVGHVPVLLVLLLAAAAAPAQNPCALAWQPGISGLRGMDGPVEALATFDAGSGPALYAGGSFAAAGAVPAANIARWNGSLWLPVGGGMNGTVLSLAVFDDGTGPALYAGGTFTSAGGVPAANIARWNGATWSAVGGGTDGAVYVLFVHDDGTGPKLFAGGAFTAAGGLPVNFVARWSGTAWSALGSGMNGVVLCLASFDDGNGSALYAGGGFTAAGGAPANRVARWNGLSWQTLGAGTDGFIWSLAAFDGGTGPALWAGGSFAQAGGVAAPAIAAWRNGAWAAAGAGFPGFQIRVKALAVFDDGSGPALFLGTNSTLTSGIARWSGAAWTTVGGGVNGECRTLAAFDPGGGPALFAGGDFTLAGGLGADRIAAWRGTWSTTGWGFDGSVDALAAFDDGSGTKLFADGGFTTAGGVAANHVGRWNGVAWTPAGLGLGGPSFPNTVKALAAYDDGTGAALYAAGDFAAAPGGGPAVIARWNGTVWTALPGTFSAGPFGIPEITCLAVFDDGSGPALYAGGTFFFPGVAGTNNIARWNGAAWSAVGGGVSGGSVSSLIVFDDGTGPALYAGGSFYTAGAVSAGRIARWNGAWAPVGPGTGAVAGLAIHDEGSGPRLWAAANFGGTGSLVRWDGTAWTVVVSAYFGQVRALASWDDGSGPGLYVGGPFQAFFGPGWSQIPAVRIGRWQSGAISGVGSGMTGPQPSEVRTVLGYDDGSGPSLYAGGSFELAGGIPSGHLARWHAPRPVIFLSQPGGPGAGGIVTLAGLRATGEYVTVFSLDPCVAGPGSGPYLGLCSNNLPVLLSQLLVPLPSPPFHFIAAASPVSFGPFAVAPGLVIEAITVDVSGGVLGCWSPVRRYTTL